MRREQDAAVGEVAVSCVEDGAAFAHLRGVWGALVAGGACSTFSRWEWLYPWWRALAPDRTPWILEARDGRGRTWALLPLSRHRVRAGAWTVRRVALLGEAHVGSDHLGVVCASGDEVRAGTAFGRFLAGRGADWDVLELGDVDVRDAGISALVTELSPGRNILRTPRSTCPVRTFVPGESFDGLLSRTARRDNFLRRRKWLGRQPGFALETASSVESVPRALAAFFELHARRWEVEGGSQGIRGPRVEAFHREAAWLLAEQGLLRLYTLRVGGEAVASVYGMSDRGTFSYYQAGYAPEWAAKSVGLVLVGETFRDALGLGCFRYDFLRGTERYKADWVDGACQTESVRVLAPTAAAAAFQDLDNAARLARGLGKALLPARVRQAVQRRRRQAVVAQRDLTASSWPRWR